MGQDQRRYTRYPVRLQVQYQHTNRDVTVSSRDLSEGGLFVATARPPAEGTAVSLCIELPEGRGMVWATGQVVHLIPGRGMGIAFSRFGPGSDERLRAYLRSLAV